MSSDLNRRDFLKISGTAVVAATTATSTGATELAQTTSTRGFAAPPIETVRIGFVGIGGQGGGHVRNLLRIPGCRITAVCDIRSERTDWATKQITDAGQPAPTVYTNGPRDFERLCETEDLDLVFNADAVGVPRPDHAVGDEARKAHGHRSAGGDDRGRLLGDGRGRGEVQEALRADGELQLRPHGDDGLQHGPAGRCSARSCTPRAATCTISAGSSSPTRGEGLWRRAWSTKLERQPLSDARPRSDRELPRHQPRRSLRVPRVDERPVARAAGLGGEPLSAGLAEAAGEVRPRRHEHQPHQDGEREDRSSSSTAPICRDRTAARTSCRARRACSRAIRTAPTSRDAGKPISG